MKPSQLSATRLVILGFAGLVLLGTVLLKLPWATAAPGISWLDAFFEATSAVTVTGLQVVTPAEDFTLFGQGILAVLIQAGGLGILTATTAGALLLGGRLGFKHLMAVNEEMNLPGGPARQRRLVGQIALVAFALESLGAVVLWVRLAASGWDPASALGYAFFHSISAFCNAGFTIFPGGVSSFAGDPIVNLAFVFLIAAGGLGFPVLVSLYRYRRRRLTLHSKLVLVTYGILLVAGVLSFAALEWTNPRTLGGEPTSTRVLESIFQGVTPRTAGFTTVNYPDLRDSTLGVQLVLMFIGAAPASTGGGIKVTTVALIFLLLMAQARGGEDVTAFGRRIEPYYIYKTLAVLSVGAALVVAGALALIVSNGWGFLPALFEATSAFGTVGLSIGPTQDLNALGKLLVVTLMFAGRVGPITLVMSLSLRSRPRTYTYPEGTIAIG